MKREDIGLGRRYQNDAIFRRLVDMLSGTLISNMFSFDDLRNAIIVARNRAKEIELLKMHQAIQENKPKG